MLTRLFLGVTRRSPKMRKIAFRYLFEYLARKSSNETSWTYMNYGYAGDGTDPCMILLGPEDEDERYCHQLYLKTVNGFDLTGSDVVEVSCGRGGGAAFVHRRLNPRTMTGIDIAVNAIKFCRKTHRRQGLRFMQGDAEDLPLFDESVDAVINVEAALLYANTDRFYTEVARVLRPGGYFLYADLRSAGEVDNLLVSLARSGLELLEQTDISANVVRALHLDAERRRTGARLIGPRILWRCMEDFAGAPGSLVPAMLSDGRMRYFTFVLRKPPATDGAMAETSLPPSAFQGLRKRA